jgi:hypothetical protein
MIIIIHPFIKLSFAHYATLNYSSLAINKLHKVQLWIPLHSFRTQNKLIVP